MATPFVQGRLRGEKVAIDATTRCSQTDREIRLHIDGDLNVEVLSPGADPYVFEPHLDWKTFSAPNIIHDY